MSYPPPHDPSAPYYPPPQQPGYGGYPPPNPSAYPPNPSAYPPPNPSYAHPHPPQATGYPAPAPAPSNPAYPPPATGFSSPTHHYPTHAPTQPNYPSATPAYPSATPAYPSATPAYPPQATFPTSTATPPYDPYAQSTQTAYPPNGPNTGYYNPAATPAPYPSTSTSAPTPSFPPPPNPSAQYQPPPSIGASFPQHSTATPNYAPQQDGTPLYPPPKPQSNNPYGDDDGMGAAFPAAFDAPAPYTYGQNAVPSMPPQPQAGYNPNAPTQGGIPTPNYGYGGSSGGSAASTQHQNVPIAQRGPLWPNYVKPVHPSVLSLTCGAIPKDNALRLRSNIPCGAVFRPLVDPAPGEVPLPVINPGAVGVVRCKDCRGYINPYVRFIDGGSRWLCNLCGLANDVPSAYFSSIDSTGKRADISTGDRPELTDASIEIMAPMDYMVRPPMPPCFVFCIDVSLNSIRSGMLEVVSKTILATLSSLPGDKRTLIGFVTFDSTVHFYTLKPGSNGPQMFVVSDLEDIFLPVPDDLLVNLEDSRAAVEQLLESLPSMHQKTTDVESALGPALEGALQLMGRIGGKMQVFLSGLPSLGVGRLSNRDNPRLLGTEKESSVLLAANDHYKRLAVKFTKYQICVDLFLFAEQYIDVATLTDLAKLTGGQTLYYPFYTSIHHGNKLAAELSHTLTRTQGWEAVIRVRASKGIRIHDFHGNFFLRGTDLLALPGIDSDKSFAFELRNEETGVIGSTICLQSALLYTTSTGERRIRVHTMCIPVTSLISDLFDRINVNALCNLIAKQSIPIALGQSFEKAREQIRNRCISIMRTHRTQIMNKGGSPASVEALAALPLMTLGLIKNPAFRDGTDVRTDVRAAVLADLTSMGIVELETFVRPRMLPIHDLTGEAGLEEKTSGMITLPQEIGLSADVLRSDGVYLIDNGMEFIIRVGRDANTDFLQSVFGITSLHGIDTRTLALQVPQPQDTLSPCRRLHNILDYLRKLSSHYQSVIIVVEGEAAEVRFFNLLIEDRNITAMSLVEFINHINRGSFSQQ